MFILISRGPRTEELGVPLTFPLSAGSSVTTGVGKTVVARPTVPIMSPSQPASQPAWVKEQAP